MEIDDTPVCMYILYERERLDSQSAREVTNSKLPAAREELRQTVIIIYWLIFTAIYKAGDLLTLQAHSHHHTTG